MSSKFISFRAPDGFEELVARASPVLRERLRASTGVDSVPPVSRSQFITIATESFAAELLSTKRRVKVAGERKGPKRASKRHPMPVDFNATAERLTIAVNDLDVSKTEARALFDQFKSYKLKALSTDWEREWQRWVARQKLMNARGSAPTAGPRSARGRKSIREKLRNAKRGSKARAQRRRNRRNRDRASSGVLGAGMARRAPYAVAFLTDRNRRP